MVVRSPHGLSPAHRSDACFNTLSRIRLIPATADESTTMEILPRASTTPDPRAAENSGPQLNATVWSLTVLSLVFLGLRLYSKLWRRRRLWWDDYVLVAGWVSSPPRGILVGCGG